MGILTDDDNNAIRYAINVELVTPEVLTDEAIASPQYRDGAELEVRERVSKLANVTADDSLADIASITQFTNDQILKLQIATIKRVASKFVRSVSQRIAIEAGEAQETYEPIDWEKLEDDLLAESDALLDELNGAEPLYVLGFFTTAKAS